MVIDVVIFDRDAVGEGGSPGRWADKPAGAGDPFIGLRPGRGQATLRRGADACQEVSAERWR